MLNGRQSVPIDDGLAAGQDMDVAYGDSQGIDPGFVDKTGGLSRVG